MLTCSCGAKVDGSEKLCPFCGCVLGSVPPPAAKKRVSSYTSSSDARRVPGRRFWILVGIALMFGPPVAVCAWVVDSGVAALPIPPNVGRCVVCGAPATRSLGGQTTDQTFVPVSGSFGSARVRHPSFYCERHGPSLLAKFSYEGYEGGQGIEFFGIFGAWIFLFGLLVRGLKRTPAPNRA